MSAASQLKNVRSERDQAADQLYAAGLRYIAALDAWIESSKGSASRANEAAYSRHRKRMTETFLIRLFPDRAADLNRPS